MVGESVRGVPPPNDGFLDRWLFAYPDDLKAVGERWGEITLESETAWEETIKNLLNLEMREGPATKEKKPEYLRLGFSGRTAWKAFTDAHADEVNKPDFPDFLGGAWSKFRGYCARLALVVHLLRKATGETRFKDLEDEDLERAAALIRYFKSHCRKVRAVMGADRRVPAAQKLLDWITREKRESFKRWEAHKDLQSASHFPTPESMDGPLSLLVSHGYIQEKEQDLRHGVGRKPAAVYLVHPDFRNGRVNRENRENAPADPPEASSNGHFPDSPDLPDRSPKRPSHL
jgi:hypothetical protein